jgi:hypothetical protein
MSFINAFNDPDYEAIVSDIISRDKVDFVGEECAVNTTAAERIAQGLLGAGHYLNVDPILEEDKKRHGIGETYYAPPVAGLPVHRWAIAANEKREQVWVDQLVKRTKTKGLLICGLYHAFSVAAKLLNRGFEVEARTYVPWEKLAK